MRGSFCLVFLALIAPMAIFSFPAQESFEQVAPQAESAQAAGRTEEAVRLYSAAVRLRPSWDNGWWALGTLYYNQDLFAQAEGAFAQFVALATKPGAGYAFLALCEYETGHYERAIEHFRNWAFDGRAGSGELAHVANLHWALLLTRQGSFLPALGLLVTLAQERGHSPALVEAMGLASLRMSYLPENYPPARREMVWLAGEAAFYGALNPPEFDRSDFYVRRLLVEYGQAPNVQSFRGTQAQLRMELDAAKEKFLEELRISPRRLPDKVKPAEPQPSGATPPTTSFEQLSLAAAKAQNEKRDDEAIQLYRQALALKPEWEQGLWSLATMLYGQGRYAEARDVLRRFGALKPNDGPGRALLGMSEFQTREYARALDHLRQGMTLGLGRNQRMEPSVYFLAAALLTRFEAYDQSLRILFEIARWGESNFPPMEAVGVAALRMPLLPAEIPPERLELVRLAGEGSVDLWKQRYDDAGKLFSKLAAMYPKEPGVHFLFGLFLMSDRPEAAIGEMQRELVVYPFCVPARVRLSEEYLKTGQLDRALTVAEEAVKLDPKASATHLALGEALVAEGDLARGIHELETARDRDPELTRIRWDLVRAYSAAGRNEDARQQKEAIEKLTQLNATP